jgi:hypothetical protein
MVGGWIANETLNTLPTKNLVTPGRCDKCFTGMESHGNRNLFGLAYLVVPPAIFIGLLIKGKNKKQGERENTLYDSEDMSQSSNQILKYEYNPMHASKLDNRDSNGKLVFQHSLRILIFIVFCVPYFAASLAKIDNLLLKTTVEYLSLFIGMLCFVLFGFDLLKKIGLYREGEMVNLGERNSK